MNANQFVRQFILDGLFGLGTTVVLSLLMNVVTLNSLSYVFYLFPHLMFVTIITSFLGTGLGTLLLANVSSRASWLISLFGVSLVSWLVAMASIVAYMILFSEPRYRAYELHALPVYAASSAFGAGIGFVISSLIGLIFTPSSHNAKAFLSGIITAFTGYTFALFYVIILSIPT
jgi:hypothetical protein